MIAKKINTVIVKKSKVTKKAVMKKKGLKKKTLIPSLIIALMITNNRETLTTTKFKSKTPKIDHC